MNNPSKQDTVLSQWDSECKLAISKAKELADTSIEADADKFKRNVLDNIPQHFGDFLYTALGDRVTGQRSSVINSEFISNNPDEVKAADEAGITLETYFAEKANGKHTPDSYSHYEEPQIFITAGRKFGMSYFTGSGTRVHTVYFGAGKAFKYLTQDHVKCIKNRHKRECTQKFLDFRDGFIHGLDGLDGVLLETPIDVDSGVVSIIDKSVKVNNEHGNWNNTNRTQFTCMDSITPTQITHTLVTMQKYDLWNKVSRVSGSSVRNNSTFSPSYISLMFLNISDNKMSAIGNVDISVASTEHGLRFADNNHTRNVIHHLDFVQWQRLNQEVAIREAGFSDMAIVDPSGILMNMDKVIENPAVRDILDKRINFYMDHSAKLQELKHEYADLYFVNADI